ncbi:MAG TPA: AtpZ/AtpI family protein [Alphaproteobacteria bacterium]|nr:AtpZ/AtpI family protein [Alphaproteobacteria bacterium]
MAEKKTPPSLEDLEARLREARAEQSPSPEPTSSHRQMGIAYRVLVEMIAGIGVGAAVGWWLDGWFGTRPIFLLVMLVLGFAAAMLNVHRAIRAAGGGWGKDQTRRGPSGSTNRE